MKKVKNSFGGIIVGIIMLIAGTCLLWWNEGNNVKNIHALDEVKKAVVEVSSDKIDSKYEGKLVATNGKLNVVDEKISDEKFGISVKSANLERVVEVYEWVESSSTDDDGNTNYTYDKKWSTTLDDSSQYHQSGHDNPKSLSVESANYYAENVKIGAYTLASSQKTQLSTDTVFNVEDTEPIEGYKKVNGYMTTSADYDKPEIGDIRISWRYNSWTEASVLAKQKGDSFEAYVTKNGKEFNRVEKGIVSADQFVEHIQKEDKLMKWLFRGIGAVLIIFGYLSLMSPLSTLSSFVPILGNIVGGILGVIAFLVGLVHSLVVIVIAWFRFRPVLSIILIAVIVVLVVLLVTLLKKNKTKKVEQPATQA